MTRVILLAAAVYAGLVSGSYLLGAALRHIGVGHTHPLAFVEFLALPLVLALVAYAAGRTARGVRLQDAGDAAR